jgi:hypothetical protein
MQWFWQGGFAPLDVGPLATASWLWTRVTNLFSQTMHYRLAVGWVVLTAIGVGSLSSRRRLTELAVVAGPLVLAVGAALLHQYPFTSGRVQLFLVPAVLLLSVEGATQLGVLLARIDARAAAAPLLALSAVGIHALVRTDVPPEIVRHPVRPFLQYAHAHWQSGDRIVVRYDDVQPLMFYAPRLGIDARDLEVGPCAGDPAFGAVLRNQMTQARRIWVAAADEESAAFRTALTQAGIATPVIVVGDRNPYGLLIDVERVPDAMRASLFQAVEPAPAPQSKWTCYGVFATGQARR